MRPKKKMIFELTEFGKQRQALRLDKLIKSKPRDFFSRYNITKKDICKMSDVDKVYMKNLEDKYKENQLVAEQCFELVPERSKFKYNINTAQFNFILNILNKWLFVDQVNLETFTNALNCKPLESSIKVKNNRLLTYTFDQLEKANFIAYNWQDVIDCNKIFCSRNGKVLNKYDLANAKKDCVIWGDPRNSDKIDVVIKAIKHL